MTHAVLLVLSYLIGGIPTSYLIARHVAGLDLRKRGSGNLGATNLHRVLGPKFAIPAGAIDVLKGTTAATVIASLAGTAGWIPWAHGAAAILGHVFPVYLKFRGGKGVATAAGVLLALGPIPLLGSAVVWVLVLWLSGIMSLASVSAALAFPLVAVLTTPGRTDLLWAGLGIATLILITHRSNLRRLWKGTERRLSRDRREALR